MFKLKSKENEREFILGLLYTTQILVQIFAFSGFHIIFSLLTLAEKTKNAKIDAKTRKPVKNVQSV